MVALWQGIEADGEADCVARVAGRVAFLSTGVGDEGIGSVVLMQIAGDLESDMADGGGVGGCGPTAVVLHDREATVRTEQSVESAELVKAARRKRARPVTDREFGLRT